MLPSENAFDAQHKLLKENLVDRKAILLNSKMFKIEMGDQVTYWVGDKSAQKVSIIVDTERMGNFCKVVLTSKNPLLGKNISPYASDLYVAIKQDVSNLNLVFSSDGIMSDDAIRLWSGMVDRGGTISVYDTFTKEYKLSPVIDSDQLQQFIGDKSKIRYVFVLSENKDVQLGLKHSFDIMELKRKTIYPLFEEFRSRTK